MVQSSQYILKKRGPPVFGKITDCLTPFVVMGNNTSFHAGEVRLLVDCRVNPSAYRGHPLENKGLCCGGTRSFAAAGFEPTYSFGQVSGKARH